MNSPTRLVDLCSEGLFSIAADGTICALNAKMTEMFEAWGETPLGLGDLPFGDAFRDRWDVRDENGFASRFEVAAKGLTVGVRAIPHVEHGWILACTDETGVALLQDEVLRLRRVQGLNAMVRGIVHDLNNVMGSIIGFSDHLAEAALTEESRYFFDHMQVSASKGAALLRAATDYMQSARSAVERVDLGQLVSDSFLLVEKAVVLEGRELVKETVDEPVSVWCVRAAAVELITQLCLHLAGGDDGGDSFQRSAISIRSGRELSAGREFGFVELSTDGAAFDDAVLSRLIDRPEAGLQKPVAALARVEDSLLDGLLGLRLGGGQVRWSVAAGRRCLWLGYPVARSLSPEGPQA